MSESFQKELLSRIDAGQVAFSVDAVDLRTLQEDALAVCKKRGISLYRWGPGSHLECLYCADISVKLPTNNYAAVQGGAQLFNSNTDNITCDVVKFSKRIIAEPRLPADENSRSKIQKNSLILVEFLDILVQNVEVIQNIVDAIAFGALAATSVRLLFAPYRKEIQEFTPYLLPLAFPLPTEKELHSLFVTVQKDLCHQLGDKLSAIQSWITDKSLWSSIIFQLKGLNLLDAEAAIYYAAGKHWKDDHIDNVVRVIAEHKMVAISRSGALTYIPYDDQPKEDEVGGFENFLQFIKLRANAYSKEAEECNIDKPKGVALLGLPGTGKSLAAKALGRMLQLPVVIMDIGSLFGKWVGESENRTRDALRTIDGIDGCVLVIDEVDKAFAGTGRDDSNEVSERVFGSILTWLQEHKSKTFVVITMNNAERLPPEFLRAGRFDKLFYTTLPTPKERRKIITLHLKKRGAKHNFKEQDWKQIIEATERFVGAELEEAVKEARLVAFNTRKNGNPTVEELIACCKDRIPMLDLDDGNRISRVMEYCLKRGTPVSFGEEEPEEEPEAEEKPEPDQKPGHWSNLYSKFRKN